MSWDTTRPAWSSTRSSSRIRMARAWLMRWVSWRESLCSSISSLT
ncbi:MAG: hypothetical protein ACLS63_04835 [Flavonifractor plautii]